MRTPNANFDARPSLPLRHAPLATGIDLLGFAEDG